MAQNCDYEKVVDFVIYCSNH